MLALLEIAVRAALETAPILRSYHEGGVIPRLKEDQSPVTEADLAADTRIRKVLQSSGIPILSEEVRAASSAERAKWERFWVVDPLDGTKEFIAGRDEYAINIALVEDGNPVLGVIAVPARNLIYMAHPRIGAMRAPEAALKKSVEFERWVLPARKSRSPFTIVISRSHLRPETEALIEAERVKHPDLKVIRSGSALKFCLLAEGDADLYPRHAPCMLWDTAAGEALVLAAGMEMVNLDSGKPLDYRGESLVNPPFVVREKLTDDA